MQCGAFTDPQSKTLAATWGFPVHVAGGCTVVTTVHSFKIVLGDDTVNYTMKVGQLAHHNYALDSTGDCNIILKMLACRKWLLSGQEGSPSYSGDH